MGCRAAVVGVLLLSVGCGGSETGPEILPGAADATVSDAAQDGVPADIGTDAGTDAGLDVGVDVPDPDVEVADPPKPDSGPVVPPGAQTAQSCFSKQWPEDGKPPVDYDQYSPKIGSHCKGTNHQDIAGVERVVFVGDSITVGTPPTAAGDWYRNRLAASLAQRFGLKVPDWSWQNVDVLNGVSLAQESGDFACCAKWGARTDDISQPPHEQLQTCIPEAQRDKVTLIVATVGGNDIFAWAQDLAKGVSIEEIQASAKQAVADLEASIHWVVDEPAKFPNGVFVVFANTYEFTDVDSGKDLATCPGAGLISMDTALIDPALDAVVAWMMAEYMRIAVETGTDLAFMGEHFCGHGYMYNVPGGRCYRGEGAELWLDFTCMHPSGAGHAAIADLFLSVIDE